MKAFLPPTPSQRGSSVAVSSNATYRNTKAAVEAALSTAAAADALLARSASVSQSSLPLTLSLSRSPSTRRPSSRNTLATSASATPATGGQRRRESAATSPTKPPATAPASATAEATLTPPPPQGDVEVFPPWIRERKDFQVFFPRYADRVVTDDEILRQGVPKDPRDRNIVELQCLARWIMKIPSMASSLDLSQATEIAKLATYQHFRPREYVFRKGDRGDACYLVFAGEVNVLINNEKVATVGKNTAFGDIALQIENATRGADVQAAVLSPHCTTPVGGGVEVLTILAEDYHKTLARCQSRRRKHLISWLHTEVPIFRDCVESKLHFFELVSIDVPLQKGDVLYAQGDSIGAFYVVKRGRVRLDVDIQYEHKHRWPRGVRDWEEQIHRVTARAAFHAEDAGGFFGFEMFVDGAQQRAYTVVAESSDVELVALNRVDCFSPYFSFTPRAIDKILDKHHQCRALAAKRRHQKLRDFHRQASQRKRSSSAGSTGGEPLVVAPKFAHSRESPQFQFPRLAAARWEADNDVVRALQRACAT